MKTLLHWSLLSILLISCHSSQKMNQAFTLTFDKQGHRGCRGLLPENTLPAMLHAIDLGVTTLEMDIVFTKDSQAILSHEPFFNHEITTKPDGSLVTLKEEKLLNLFNMSYADVQQYDVGLKPHPRFPQQQKIKVSKPRLVDVIDSVETYIQQTGKSPVYYNIETKTQPFTDAIYHPAPEPFVNILLTIIKNKRVEDRVIIQSFDERTLQVIHRKAKGIKTALLIEDTDKRDLKTQLEGLGFTPTYYSPHYSLVTKAVVDRCHRLGMKVIPWTVNDLKEMQRLIALQVDGIITDYPNLFSSLQLP